jgi:cellulose synthase/poly-beta-1,6-N-acetylglucosamine synthase-like glycosyltransferase
MEQRAKLYATDPLRELLASGIVAEDRLAAALGECLGITSRPSVPAERILGAERGLAAMLARPPTDAAALVAHKGEPAMLLMTPGPALAAATADVAIRVAKLGQRMSIVTPSALRVALISRCRSYLVGEAVHALDRILPQMSARHVANGWQCMVFGALAVLLPVLLALAPHHTIMATHLLATLFFFACVHLRVGAAVAARPPRLTPLRPFCLHDAPRYSVLVTLHREAEIVPDLLVALGRLVWPRSKLEIKLVCEADDGPTLAALAAQPLKPWIEVIEVPPGLPRTKPKALAYALPLCSGELIALYDAEDRPHPEQLVEAWQHFEEAEAELACLQAPLSIDNSRDSLIARAFAFEYAALFRGLLPWLSSLGLFFPLGGTSNHFRRAALEACGDWDPYNVTEDADLALRFCRFGYTCRTITRPTLEDGPTRFSVWLPQRTRWFKGWMQCWLVHMRRPYRLAAEMGSGSFLVAQIMLAGMIVSALVHPILVASLLYLLATLLAGGPFTAWHSALLTLDIVNIGLGYGAFLALGRRTLLGTERRGFHKVVLFTPVYWMMMSVAAWRALGQLILKPHLWEKTEHPSRRRRQAAAVI